MAVTPVSTQCLCGSDRMTTIFEYKAPPAKETHYQFAAGDQYRRMVRQCTACGHLMSFHDMNADALYAGDYVNATYGEAGLRKTFDKINGLDPAKSDNIGRVKRLIEFTASQGIAVRPGQPAPTVLDVGSGLCVFLYQMVKAGWSGTALDPDARAVKHAEANAGVIGICADFIKAGSIGQFDLVTLNKVLEHVQDPRAMLRKTKDYVKPAGLVYVEVPDGEIAARHGSDREEFTIDHWHIYSAASLALLAYQEDFQVLALERLYEPSTKYTLRAFLRPVAEKG